MSDLIPIGDESAPGKVLKPTPTYFRNAVKLMLRPGRRLFRYFLKDTIARLEHLESRLNRVEWLAEVFQTKADGLSTHVDSLSTHLHGLARNQWEIQSRVDALECQCEGLLRLLPGIDNRFETLSENQSAVQALHWDHVALARRLGAIEDVLAATGEAAKETIEDGRGRPLLPFPGLESHDLKKSKASRA